MKSSNPDSARAQGLLTRWEAWLCTIRVEGGWGGPVFTPRQLCLEYCGPGMDWRLEGLLDGLMARHATTQDAAILDLIEATIGEIQAAQWQEAGVFRNSGAEGNPLDAGMPHEPAMLAAVCRALSCLEGAGRAIPAAWEAMIVRYVERHLLLKLWNKLLETFNDWAISDFDRYNIASVAAALELLVALGERTGRLDEYRRFIEGAARSLVTLQVTEGPLAGGLPPASDSRGGVSPFLAARALRGLRAAERSGAFVEAGQAAARLAAFLARQCRPEGAGIVRMLYSGRKPSTGPVPAGAVAYIAETLIQSAEWTERDEGGLILTGLAERQQPTGAMTAWRGRPGVWGQACRRPDLVDVMPSTDWQCMLYPFLARLASADVPFRFQAGACQPVRRRCRYVGRGLQFYEDAHEIRLSGMFGTKLYRWEKGRNWCELCLL
jgi:hypothetical protein